MLLTLQLLTATKLAPL